MEKTPEEYVSKMVEIFREVRRVLKKEGTCWVNLGDTYIGGGRGFDSPKQMTNKGTEGIKNLIIKPTGNLKSKDLCGIPWRVALALQADGWWLRQDIIWHKPNPMPESVTDRCTKAHEYVFLLTKNARYYFDSVSIKEEGVWDVDGTGTIKRKERQRDGLKSNPTDQKNGIRIIYPSGKHKNGQQSPKTVNGYRNKRSVWSINTQPYSQAHFATFPPKLIEPMILAGCPVNGIVLDPFIGAGTTAIVAKKLGRNYTGIELNKEYIKMANKRIEEECGTLF